MRTAKIGVLMDSLECSSCLANVINSLAGEPNIALYLILSNAHRDAGLISNIVQNICDVGIHRFINDTIFNTCMAFEQRTYVALTQNREHFLETLLDAKIFADIILVNPIFSQTANSKRMTQVSYNDIDIQKIKELDLDLILQGNVAGILQDNILGAAEKGIISFPHVSNQWNCGTALGFWEVYFKVPATEFVVQIANEGRADENIIFRGEITTKSLYASNLMNLCHVASPFVVQIIKDYATTRNIPPSLPKKSYSNMLSEIPRFTRTLNYFIRTYPAIALPFLKRRVLGRHRRWSIAYTMSDWMTADLSKATVIQNPKGRFLADPFVMTYGDETVIFAEDYHYSNKQGVISAVKLLSDGSYDLIPNIIKEDFHLSFPYIFEYRGDLYMVPESNGAGTIRLYRCTQYPHKWEYLYDIMEGVSAADTMLFEHSDRWWMLTNIAPDGTSERCTQLCAFNADSPLSRDWHPHPRNPICFSAEFGRNGGILRDKDRAIYRVRQKQGFCQYGAAMSIAKIVRLDMENYDEVLYREIRPNFLPNLTGTHHMHSNGTITVFDFSKMSKLESTH